MTWAFILLGLSVGGLFFTLMLPAPEEHHLPWEEEAEGARTWLDQFAHRQQVQLSWAGIKVNALIFTGLRVGLSVSAAVGAGALLGPISGGCGAIGSWLVVQEWLRSRHDARLLQFADQFRETLQSIVNSLKANRSMAQALLQGHSDLIRVPGREDGLLAHELERMLEELRLGAPLDTVMHGLVTRVPLEEVQLFADAVNICRVRGGNLVQVLQTLVRLNVDRFQVRQEVRVQTAQKRGEGTIISLLPLGLLFTLTLIAPDYMEPLTSTFAGQAMIGVGLFFILLAYLISRAFTRIEV
jgi:tight adherence protein B